MLALHAGSLIPNTNHAVRSSRENVVLNQHVTADRGTVVERVKQIS